MRNGCSHYRNPRTPAQESYWGNLYKFGTSFSTVHAVFSIHYKWCHCGVFTSHASDFTYKANNMLLFFSYFSAKICSSFVYDHTFSSCCLSWLLLFHIKKKWQEHFLHADLKLNLYLRHLELSQNLHPIYFFLPLILHHLKPLCHS